MRILRLMDSIVTPAVASKYTDPVTGKSYFNLTHGTKGPNTWVWRAGMCPNSFHSDQDQIKLDGCEYTLSPIYKKAKLLKDARGNTCYNILIDNDPTHKRDFILLWAIPGRPYKDIKFDLSGNVELIGEGVYGKQRGTKSITYPAPVLEIFGDCVLVWEGLTKDNKQVKQVIKYKHNTGEWTIGSVDIS